MNVLKKNSKNKLKNKKFLYELSKIKENYRNNQNESVKLNLNNFNQRAFTRFFNNNDMTEITFNVIDKEVNLSKKCKLLVYGYIYNINFIWIKNFNKIFHANLKKYKFLNENFFLYFFNKTLVKLKKENNYYIIPYIVFNSNPDYNVIEFEDTNKIKIFGLYKII